MSRPAAASPPLLPRLRRHLVLVVLLAAGAGSVVAADTLFANHSGSSLGTPGQAIPAQKPAKRIPLPATARRTAVAFVQSTVFRQDLATGWRLVDHASPVAAGFSRKRFLTGSIPVVPFPAGSAMRYRVVHSHPRDVLLEVMLEPPAGRAEKATVFLLGEQRAGSAGPWRVTYWSPRPAYGVPSS